jgi:hypothetical protein
VSFRDGTDTHRCRSMARLRSRNGTGIYRLRQLRCQRLTVCTERSENDRSNGDQVLRLRLTCGRNRSRYRAAAWSGNLRLAAVRDGRVLLQE